MLEAAGILGGFAALLLVGAFALWAKLFRGPELQRLNGRRPPSLGKIEVASRLLLITFSLSAVAAVLAVADWITGG